MRFSQRTFLSLGFILPFAQIPSFQHHFIVFDVRLFTDFGREGRFRVYSAGHGRDAHRLGSSVDGADCDLGSKLGESSVC